MPCDPKEAAQMWQFSKQEPTDFHFHGGILSNMKGGCLSFQGTPREGQTLKVVECNKNHMNQHWLSNGDETTPREKRDLCLSPVTHPIQNRDPVVLAKCEDTFSLDY